MEYNFDKEIDTLLRQAARGDEIVSTVESNAHLDADEISMFAENALPEKARNRATKHLAECNDCRSVLSNLILLNEETETETVSSAIESEVQTAVIPWYKKLFVFPQIAYATGALALVFSGFVGFLIYQTTNQTGSFEMAKSSPATMNTNASGPNAGDNEPEFNESSSNSMSANANLATVENRSTDGNLGGTSATKADTFNANIAVAPTDDAEQNQEKNKRAELPTENRPAPAAKSKREEELKETTETTDNDIRSAEDSVTTQNTPMPQPRITTRAPQKSDKKDADQTKLAGKTETRKQIGGKIFNLVNGVWIDSEYGRSNMGNLQLPMTTIVRRGSSQYKNLDKNIRTIAESLDGTVIIVSGGKAFQIQ